MGLKYINQNGEENIIAGVGADGEGLPAGGAIGQILRKKSEHDYDTEWIDETIEVINSTDITDKESKTYSAKVIDELIKDVYITGEQIVGTWLDGKTLYRQAGEIPVVENENVLSNIKTYNFKRVTGWLIRDDGFENQVTVYTGESDYATLYRSQDKKYLSISTIYSGTLIYEVLYTKTELSIINFTVNCSATNIGNKIYQAEEGMTWAEWVDSEYNVDGYYLEEDNNKYIRLNSSYYLTDAISTDTIQSGTVYETSKGK